MAMNTNWKNPHPVRCITPECYFVVLRAEGNATSAPDGGEPTNGVTWTYDDVGDYTVTFAEADKPHRILWAEAHYEENLISVRLAFSGYTASTGTATFHSYNEDNTSGIEASADETDKTISILMLCTNSGLNDA